MTSPTSGETPAPTQASPSPDFTNPSRLIVIGSPVGTTFAYSDPPPCSVLDQSSHPTTLGKAVEVLMQFASGSAFVQIMIRGYNGYGRYAPNAAGNQSYVLYSDGGNAADSWMSTQGIIEVLDATSTTLSGTVEADLSVQSDTASFARGTSAYINGVWACALPPGA